MKTRLIITSITFITLVGIALGLHFSSEIEASGDSYSISRFATIYTIGKDDAGHSAVSTQETITAHFPTEQTHHGITRTLLNTRQDGARIGLTIKGVTDENGQTLPYTAEKIQDGFTLKIGDAERYVYGDVTYVIEYSLTDPTVYYAKTDRQEWYWNTVGFGWDVPIHNYSATVILNEPIASTLQGSPYCYVGVYGSKTTCAITKQSDGSYRTQIPTLKKGENVSLAFGFANGTFVQRDLTFLEKYFALSTNAVVQTTAFVISLLSVTFVICLVGKQRYGWGKLHGIIPAQYIPPKDIPLPISAYVMMSPPYQTATILNLATKHYINIIETQPKSVFKKATYSLEIVRDLSSVSQEEKLVLQDLFETEDLLVGKVKNLEELKKGRNYGKAVFATSCTIESRAITEYGLYEKEKSVQNKLTLSAAVAFLLAAIFFSWPFVLAGILIAVVGYNYRRITPKGLELKRYLKGYKKYIVASEANRLKMLQGPDTAEKTGLVGFDTNNTAQLIHLYEQSLPYAVLFGQEKKWSKHLDILYQTSGERPSWYGSTSESAISLAIIVGGVSHITGAGRFGSFYSGTGGSAGGGFSGGGGGGGGGGSW